VNNRGLSPIVPIVSSYCLYCLGRYNFAFTNPDTISGRFINWVSKVHDPMNSWNYRDGSYYFQGPYHDLMFQALSVTGMLPAAAFTGSAHSAGSVPSGQTTIISAILLFH